MLGFEGLPVSTIGALDDHISPAVGNALLATAKTLGRTARTPRRDPLDGLDCAVAPFSACRPNI